MAETRKVVSLSEVLKKVRKLQGHKWDRPARWSDTQFRAGQRWVRLAVRDRGRSLTVMPTAFEQVCRQMGIPPGYAASLDPTMAIKLLNYERRRRRVDRRKQPMLIRGYGNLLRGVVSDRYVPLDDAMAVAAVRDALAERQVRVHHCRVGLDGLELRLVFEDLRLPLLRTGRVGDVVSPGLYLRNSEVGLGCLVLECFILRLVCANGLVLPGDSTFHRWRHVAVNPEQVVAEIHRAVGRVAGEVAETVGLLDQAADRGVRGGAREALGALAHRESLSRDLTGALLHAYDKDAHDSLFGVVNAVTAAARSLPAAMRTRLELLAGSLLMQPEQHGIGVAPAS